MFQLSLLDHLRLTFGHVVHHHQLHAKIAHASAQRSRWTRGAETLLMTATAVCAVGAASGMGRIWTIASAVFAVLSLLTLLLHLTFDFDGAARLHASCAARLARILEQYRALLSDWRDGAIDAEGARRGRDVLMSEVQAIYENAPAADLHAAGQTALSDDDIDGFLPASLQKPDKSSTT